MFSSVYDAHLHDACIECDLATAVSCGAAAAATSSSAASAPISYGDGQRAQKSGSTQARLSIARVCVILGEQAIFVRLVLGIRD